MLIKELISVILILFPLTCYIVYLGQYNSTDDKKRNLYLDLSLYTSLYLYIKYAGSINDYSMIILINIPFLISIIKNRKITTTVLSILIISMYRIYCDYDIVYLLSEYILYYLLSNMAKDKSNILKVVLYFSVIKLFISIVYLHDIIVWDRMLFMFISIIILYMFQIGEKVMDMNLNIKKLKKEKVINDSIFKITHEIKNPIAVCKGYLDMFDVDDIEKSSMYVKCLKEEIDRTLELLKDFLNFSKINVEKEEMDVAMLVDEIYDNFKEYVNTNKIQITLDNIDDEVYIDGDYKRLKQVFINLIKNSMEAIKEKDINDGQIKLTGKIENNFYNVTVYDNGVGIDDKTIKEMYKPFFTTKQDGTGLGVCFSKEVIDAHKGNIDYYSEFGKWTKVILKFPLKNSN